MEETRVLTIVFTDIKGFTERTSSSDREAVSRLLAKHEELLLPLVSSYDGRLIKTIGDAFLLTFASPTNAVLCAVMMQETLKEYNASLPVEEKIEIRIAINTGEVLLRDGDVFGEPVNIAARIEALTEANEVWFSESTYLAMNRKEVPTSLIGEYRLKGIPEAVKVYRVLRDENDQNYLQTVAHQLEKLRNSALSKVLPVPTAKPGRALHYLAAVLAIVIVFLLLRESELDKHLRLAEEAKNAGNFSISIENLKSAAKLKPGDAEIFQKLGESIDLHVGLSLKTGHHTIENIEKLDMELSEIRALFPVLEKKLLRADIELAMAKANLWAVAPRREEADLILDQLAEKAGKDAAVLFQIAEFYGRYGYNWTRTIKYIHAAAVADPVAYATHPVVIEQLTWFLEKIAPSDGYHEVRQFIASRNFDYFADSLRNALYGEGEEFHTMRWNALKILQIRGEKIDELKVYLIDLLTSPGDVNSEELKEITGYFAANSGPALGEKLNAHLATLPKKFPLFEKFMFETDDPVMKVAAGPLFLHLQAYLHELLASEQFTTRFNAFLALKLRNDLSTEEKWLYCFRTIEEFRRLQWSSLYYPRLLEALDFMLKNPLPEKVSATDTFNGLAKTAAGALKAMIDQDLEAIAKKTDLRYFKLDVRSQDDMEKLLKKLQKF
ncbi:MAG: adenylate/guanylate cyclase domain-containing protein [Candidatus Rifleibacteriota bacterium]